MTAETVVVAMSGGVDSSVAAKMMVDLGYRSVGMTMRLYKGAEAESCSTGQSCCGEESVDDARLVANKLGIPYYAINFREEFWENVVQVFAREYFAGRTPSPCILCNERLKFDALYKKAMEIGAAYVVTGHYARIGFDEAGDRWNLLRGKDRSKDQSYFLFSMTQEQLSKTLFPCGEYSKPEIRAFAEEADLVTAKKPESQDICFIPDGDYAAFLERHFPELAAEAKGKIRHVDGTVLGDHNGIHSVTVGQRKVGIAFNKPLYVSSIDPLTKDVVMGEKHQAEKREMTVSRVNWIAKDPAIGESFRLHVKIRSRSPESRATVTALPDLKAHVLFDEPQLAITPGQASVFYDDEKVFGGGWID
jgi:tRNA-specific 2-thiouridylase